MKISYKQISHLCIIIFFSIALNPEWSTNSIIWWMSIFATIVATIASNGFKIHCKIDLFKIWAILFLAICCISIVYALNKFVSFESVKTLIILFIILFLIDDEMESKEDIETYTKLFLVSLFIMMIYVLFKVDLKSFQLAQHGEASTGLWNGNDIGMKCALFIIIMLHFINNNTKRILHIFLMFLTIPAFILVYYTASRKAFLMIVFGISLFYYLKHPTKKIRNLLVIIISVYIGYMLLMNVDALYNAIGWRIEGALALFEKNGKADSSALLRAKYINVGIKAWKESMMLGYGIDNYRIINLMETGHFTYSHNNFVEILVGVGGMGFLIYYSYYIILLYKYIKMYFNHRTSQIINVIAICFIIMLSMHFAVVSYYSIEQGIMILLMSKAVQLNQEKNLN